MINPCPQSSLWLIEAGRKSKKSYNNRVETQQYKDKQIHEHQHIKLTRQKIHIFQKS